MFRDDVRSVLERDPAARHWIQIVLFYPGVHAIWAHRVAHWLWTHKRRFLAETIAATNRFLTGIEIHPAAKIGPRLFIDHGMGVVIGETAEIGADVTLYHGVTLGGVSLTHGKRHPTLESRVVVGAGAKILGAITIGEGTRVGANSVVIKDTPPHSVVVGIPGKPIVRAESVIVPEPLDFQHGNLPDVVSEKIDLIFARLERLESQASLDLLLTQEMAVMDYHI